MSNFNRELGKQGVLIFPPHFKKELSKRKEYLLSVFQGPKIDSRVGARNVNDEPGTSCYTK